MSDLTWAADKEPAKDQSTDSPQTQLKGMTIQKDGRVVFKDKKEAMEAFKNLLRDRQVWPLSQFFLFPFCKKS